MANNEKTEVKEEVKKEKSTLVHDSICLFVITLVAGLLLGAVYSITVDPIDKQNEKKKQEAYAAVYDGAEFETDSDIDKKLEDFNKELAAGKISSEQMGVLKDVVIEEVMKAKVDGSDAGYVLTCSGKGYGGAVKMALGIDAEGAIKGIQITDCTNETPGLGQNSSNSEWNGQYVGTNASQDLTVVKGEAGSAEAGTISAISGATITSSAVTRAVDGAFQFIASLG
ncbi:MAG: RnfABCDGE type electron transport complex subunit G [Lachnospiraceae bacterium]|nr:RnfABCDGE type electron transport complex subunit G [Lachnospiraceae bacterium]